MGEVGGPQGPQDLTDIVKNRPETETRKTRIHWRTGRIRRGEVGFSPFSRREG